MVVSPEVVVTRPVWEIIRDLIRLWLKQVRRWHMREYFRASGQLHVSLCLNMAWSIYSFCYIRSFGLVNDYMYTPATNRAVLIDSQGTGKTCQSTRHVPDFTKKV